MPASHLDSMRFPTPIARALDATLNDALPYVQRFPNLFATTQQLLRFSGIIMISEYFKRPSSRTDPEFTRFFSNLRTPTFGTWAALLDHFRNISVAEQAEMPATREIQSAYQKTRRRVRSLIEVRNERYGHRNLAPDETETAKLYAEYFPQLETILECFQILQKAKLYYRFKDDKHSVYACMGTDPLREQSAGVVSKINDTFDSSPFVCFFDSKTVIPLYPLFEMELQEDTRLAPLLFDGWRHSAIVYMSDNYRRTRSDAYPQVAATFKSHKIPFPDVPIKEVSLSTLSGYANECSRRNVKMLQNRKYFAAAYVERQGIDDRVNHFLSNGPEPALLILSKAGMGKTSLLCHVADGYLAECSTSTSGAAETRLYEGNWTVVFINLTSRNSTIWETTRNHMGLAGSETESFQDLLHCWARLVDQENVQDPRIVFILDALDECGNLKDILREVADMVHEAGDLNLQAKTRNAVKIILSARKMDFERAREAISGDDRRDFNLFSKHTDQELFVELEPFTGQQAKLAFSMLGNLLAPHSGQNMNAEWERLPASIQSLLREPLFVWMYHTVFPPGEKRLPPPDITEGKLWKAFFEYALGDGTCPVEGESPPAGGLIHRFFVERLMAFCDQASSLIITSEIIDKVERMAAEERRVGRTGIVPFDLLTSRNILLRAEKEDLECCKIELSYSFVHRSIAEQALCLYFKGNRSKYPALDAAFFHGQLQRLDSFDGLRGALVILLEEMWMKEDFRVWWEGLDRCEDPNWAMLLADSIAVIARKHLCRMDTSTFQPNTDRLCRTWKAWLTSERLKNCLGRAAMLTEKALCRRMDGVSLAHYVQIPMIEHLLAHTASNENILSRPECAAVAILKRQLSEAYSLRGNSGRSFDLLKESAEKLEAVVRDNNNTDEESLRYRHDLSRVYSRASALCRQAGKRLEAERYISKGIEMMEALNRGGLENPDFLQELASEISALAVLHLDKGELEKSMGQAFKALSIQEKLLSGDENNTRLKDAVSKSHSLLSKLHKKIGERGKALQHCMKSLEFREQIASLDIENICYQDELATTYGDLSDLYKETGKRDKALEYCCKTLSIRENIALLDKENITYQNGLATIYAGLATLHKEMGQREKALEYRMKNLGIRERIVELDKDNIDYQNRLAVTYAKIANHFMEIGQREKALEYRLKEFVISERIASIDTNNILYQSNLASAYAALSTLHKEMGQRDKALEYRLKDLDIAERIASTDENNIGYQNGLAGTYAALSTLHKEMGQRDEAFEYRMKNLGIRERIVELDKDNIDYQNRLAVTYANMANHFKEIGQREKALEYRLKEFVISERIASIDPNNILYQSNLASAYAALSTLHKEMGQRDQALEYRMKDLEIVERVASTDQNNIKYQNGLAGTYAALSTFYKEIGQRDKALEYRLKDLNIAERIASTDQNNIKYQNGLAGTYAALSILYKEIGQRDKALEYRLKDLNIAERIASTDQNNIGYQNGLAGTYAALSTLHEEIGQRGNAIEYRMKNLEIRERIASTDENNIGYQNGLAGTYAALSTLYKEMGQCDKALEYRMKDLKIAERIASIDQNNMGYQNGLADTYRMLALLYQEKGDLEKAFTYRMKNLEITEQIASIDKENLKYQNSLANAFGGLSNLLSLMGDKKKALEFRLKSLTVRERVVSLDENNIDHKEGLAIAYDALSNLYAEAGDLEKAHFYRLKDLAVSELIFSVDGSNADYQKKLESTYAALVQHYSKTAEKDRADRYEEKRARLVESLLGR